ncbi:MAG TPA: hypothetical protein VKR31_16550 [Rhizomicrobium sp.]|nr:hypothetical protein [Rhizomicrobium sp.]
MNKFMICCVAAMLFAGGGAALAREPDSHGSAHSAPEGAEAVREQLRDGARKLQNNDVAGALAELKPVVGNPGFSLLNEMEQHAAWALLGGAELQSGDARNALAHLKLATETPYSNGFEWYMRLAAAYALRDFDDSRTSLATIAKNWPGSLDQVRDQAVFQLASGAKDDDAVIGVIEPLRSANWKPKVPFADVDELWFDLAVAYLDRSDAAHAKTAFANVRSAQQLIRARIDKRFDPIVSEDPARFEVNRIFAGWLDELKKRSDANSDRLEGISGVADLLIQMGRASDALALLDNTIARAKPSDTAPSVFSDYANEINWTHNVRAGALFALGRNAEGLEALSQGQRLRENGGPNISQTINLAEALDAEGKPNDALTTLQDLDSVEISPVAHMEKEYIRACAYSQLQDRTALDKSLAYLKDHADDENSAVLNALVCAGDMDATARFVVSALGDPRRRNGMLYLLQDFKLKHKTPVTLDREKRLAALRARPDVAKAIAAVGRIETYDLFRPGY